MNNIDTASPETLYITSEYPYRGEAPDSSSSAMIGEKITSVTCDLAMSTGTAAIGTISVELRKLSDNSLLYTIGTNKAEITTSKTRFVFDGGVGADVIENSTICISGNNDLILYRSPEDSYDGTDSGRSYYTDSTSIWGVENSQDWLAIFSDIGASTGGTLLPPPYANIGLHGL